MPITTCEEETMAFANSIVEDIKNGGVIRLYGDLGTGKTTLTKGILKALGLHEIKVKSPTYTYIRKYKTGNKAIYHIDLYRLAPFDETLYDEIKEFAENSKNIIIIEWADRMETELPNEILKIQLEYIDDKRRNIKIIQRV